MTDEPVNKPDWSIAFLGRLCLIGWLCAVLYETFDFFKPIRQVFLLFGFWSCVIASLNALGLLVIRRQGIFLIFVLVAILPTIHFGFVMRNIAVQKKLIDPAEFGGSALVEPKEQETVPDQKPSR